MSVAWYRTGGGCLWSGRISLFLPCFALLCFALGWAGLRRRVALRCVADAAVVVVVVENESVSAYGGKGRRFRSLLWLVSRSVSRSAREAEKEKNRSGSSEQWVNSVRVCALQCLREELIV